ncbi:hypothetical protein Tco_0646303 [Tanacetum coccineum]
MGSSPRPLPPAFRPLSSFRPHSPSAPPLPCRPSTAASAPGPPAPRSAARYPAPPSPTALTAIPLIPALNPALKGVMSPDMGLVWGRGVAGLVEYEIRGRRRRGGCGGVMDLYGNVFFEGLRVRETYLLVSRVSEAEGTKHPNDAQNKECRFFLEQFGKWDFVVNCCGREDDFFRLPLLVDEFDAMRTVGEDELLSKLVVASESSLNDDSFKSSMLRIVSKVFESISHRLNFGAILINRHLSNLDGTEFIAKRVTQGSKDPHLDKIIKLALFGISRGMLKGIILSVEEGGGGGLSSTAMAADVSPPPLQITSAISKMGEQIQSPPPPKITTGCVTRWRRRITYRIFTLKWHVAPAVLEALMIDEGYIGLLKLKEDLEINLSGLGTMNTMFTAFLATNGALDGNTSLARFGEQVDQINWPRRVIKKPT